LDKKNLLVGVMAVILLVTLSVLKGIAYTYAIPAVVKGFGVEDSLWGFFSWIASFPWWAWTVLNVLDFFLKKSRKEEK